MIKNLITISLYCVITVSTTSLSAQIGALDNSFSTDGKLTIQLGAEQSQAAAIAVQADEKIILAGNYNSQKIAVVRLNPNGTLDTAFGTNGIVLTGPTTGYAYARAIAIQDDGKLILAGGIDSGSGLDVALVRLNTDGSLDNTFGTNGTVISDATGSTENAEDVKIQDDGKIVISGGTGSSMPIAFSHLIMRFNSDGSIDNTFNLNGMVITNIDTDDWSNALSILDNGKIITSGTTGNDTDGRNFLVTQHNSDGSLDATFGTNGIIVTNFGTGSSYSYDLEIQADGKILACGSSSLSFTVVRFETNGALDLTFGLNGVASISNGSDFGKSLIVQADGKIVMSGNRYNTDNNTNYLMVRFNTDGSQDMTFGTNGFIETDIGQEQDFCHHMIEQTDGKILMVGIAGNNIDNTVVMGMCRYVMTDVSGVNELNNSDFSVYPNPTLSSIQIPLNNLSNVSIKIMNNMGQVIFNQAEVNDDLLRIDMESYEVGLYFVKISSDTHSYTTRFIKK